MRGAHEASIWTAAWHPAGHLLATGAADCAIKFWCRCAALGVGRAAVPSGPLDTAVAALQLRVLQLLTLLVCRCACRCGSGRHLPCLPPVPQAHTPSLSSNPSRCRPGDPFFDAQQEEQRELAAMAAEAEPVAAPRPAALAAPSATFGPAGAAMGGVIPGIGDAVAMPVLPQATAAPAFDVFSIQQQPYDERGGRPPADASPAAGAQLPPGREDDSRRCLS